MTAAGIFLPAEFCRLPLPGRPEKAPAALARHGGDGKAGIGGEQAAAAAVARPALAALAIGGVGVFDVDVEAIALDHDLHEVDVLDHLAGGVVALPPDVRIVIVNEGGGDLAHHLLIGADGGLTIGLGAFRHRHRLVVVIPIGGQAIGPRRARHTSGQQGYGDNHAEQRAKTGPECQSLDGHGSTDFPGTR